MAVFGRTLAHPDNSRAPYAPRSPCRKDYRPQRAPGADGKEAIFSVGIRRKRRRGGGGQWGTGTHGVHVIGASVNPRGPARSNAKHGQITSATATTSGCATWWRERPLGRIGSRAGRRGRVEVLGLTPVVCSRF